MRNKDLLQYSDEQLVVAFQEENNPLTLEILYRRYADKVLRYCQKIVQDREEAEDISEDVFVQVFEKLGDLRNPVTFQAWLFRIAHNKSINAGLRKDRLHNLPEESLPDVSISPIEEEAESLETLIVRMNKVVDALPETMRNMLKEKYLYGDSIETLMLRYRLSESAVKMRLARARGKAKDLLSRA